MNDRDCENCIHKVNGACNSWGCKFEPKSGIYRPCSKCHNEECVFMGGSDTHSLCEDFEPKPRTGRWIKNKYGQTVCSECQACALEVETGCLVNRHLAPFETKYCPQCGAEMSEGNEE